MPTASTALQTLLSALTAALEDSSLTLNASTLASPAGVPLLQLVTDQFQLGSLFLEGVVLPESVTGDTLAVTGMASASITVSVRLDFTDLGGEVAAQLLLQAASPTSLQEVAPATLANYFFNGISEGASSASVTVPGLALTTVSAPTYGVIGLAIPSGGFVTTSIAPRVDGTVTPPGSTAKELLVEVATATTGFRLAPLNDPWGFADLGWLVSGLDLLGTFPAIIPTPNLTLSSFDLNLYPQAPDLSSISLTVAGAGGSTDPLWSAAGDTVRLNDVVVTLDLTYSDTPPTTLALAGTGSVQGNATLGSIPLVVSIPFPLTGTWSLTAYPNVSLTSLADLATLLPDTLPNPTTTFDQALPPGLSGLADFALTYLQIAVDASTYALVEFTVAFGSTATWKLVPGVLELTSLQARLSVDKTAAARGGVIGTIGLPDGGGMTVSFGRASPLLPWRLDLISPAIPLPSLTELAGLTRNAALGELVQAGGLDQLRFVMTDVNFGMTFGPAALTNLGFTLQLGNAADPINPTLDWPLIPNGVLTLTQFAFGFQLAWGADPTTPTIHAFGSFVINDLAFAITFGKGQDSNALVAEYHAAPGPDTTDLKTLIGSISNTTIAGYVPEGITIKLADALLAYLGGSGTTAAKFVFAMDVAVEIGLSDLPLVGQALPADAVVGIKQLKLVVASDPLSAADVTLINGLSPVPVLPLPPAGATGDAIPAGFSVLAELQLGDMTIMLTSPPTPPSPAQGGSALGGGSTAAVVPPAPATDPVSWLDVQQTYGPVTIAKIGFSYVGGSVSVVTTMALSVGGLDIELIGLGVTSPIDQPALAYTIQGLAVSFVAEPVSIAGGMIGTLDPLDFAGALTVQAPGIMLAAFAGYATYEDHPSFFLYGVLDVPLGGPPAFVVTGLAAGLGFNRSLVIPDVSGVADFPLVAWAMGDGRPTMEPGQPLGAQVAQVLAGLTQSGVVVPAVGSYWFAAGIRFSSFQVVDTFALLTISLGTTTEVALLGLSTLTLPAGAADPIAQIQLALEVSFSYGSGLLAVVGQLTANSYVLSRDSRLTGGFAFSLWFSGEHAGEFVLTLGGYNPQFAVPDHYPIVPRLGLSWQVVPELSITGGLYFALTSNAVMAGGKLSAVWTSGSVRAWFTYWADFLMTLNPLRYHVAGGIDLGASFTVRTRLFSISTTVHVGVALELWGPPFSGRATVNLSVISFTITFPAAQVAPNPTTTVAWNVFVAQQLPAALVTIAPTDGLVRTLSAAGAEPCYLVAAETFRCSVLTVIPSKQVTLDADPVSGVVDLAYAPDAEQPGDGQGHPTPPNTAFGAGPASLAPAAFLPAMELSLTASTAAVLHVVRQLGNAPKALWENKQFDSRGAPIVDPATGLTQATIPNTLTGLGLYPYLAAVDHTSAVDLSALLFSLENEVQPFAWSPGVPPTEDPFTNEQVASTIAAPPVAAARASLLAALAGQAVTVTTTIDVTGLADPADDDLMAAPRLERLGEQEA